MKDGKNVMTIAWPVFLTGIVLVGSGYYGLKGLAVAAISVGVMVAMAGLVMIMAWTPHD